MKNQEISKIFLEMSEILAMQEVAFKPQAYEKAAVILDGLDDDIEEIYKKEGEKGLLAIDGIGKGMAEKIEEYLGTGRIIEYEKMKKDFPVDIFGLTAVEGLGPKKIKFLYDKLGVKNIAELEEAALTGKLRDLKGFGEKTEKNILQGVKFAKQDAGRFLLGSILPLAENFKERIAGVDGVKKIEFAGSLRRRKETIGDIDFLVCAEESEKVMDFFVNMPEVEKVWARGKTKASARFKEGFDVDIRIINEESWGAALQYFTGSKDHNIKLREKARVEKMKLNEYGLYKSGKRIAGKSEKEIYKTLGLAYIEPEMREDRGEIEVAAENKLLKLVEIKDIRGDLQMHSVWSDGSMTILEMAKAARKIGHEYILITDHAGRLRIANGMNEKRLIEYVAEIDRVNKKLSGFKVLKGAEVDINKDGTLAIDDEVLAMLDIVLISVHDNFKMLREDMTERVCRAMSNRHADILAHPTGRKLLRREGYQLDMEKIFKTANETKTAIEINAYPNRLDLNDTNAKRAIEVGVKLTIGTDSHDSVGFSNLQFGVAVARRAWAEKKNILNCLSAEKLVEYFKEK